MESKEQVQYTFRLVDIKIQSFKIEDEPKENKLSSLFNFKLAVAHIPIIQENQIHVIVSISIFSLEDTEMPLSSMQIAIYFSVDNLGQIIKEGEDIPESLRLLLHSISISTARGVLFSTLKGTYLQKAILPVVDMQSMAPEIPKN
jgi:hypothetical protein